MATIAEMLLAKAGEKQDYGMDIAGNFGRGLQQGAQLAKQQEDLQVQREELEQRKQTLQMQKATAITDTLKIAASSKDKNLKNFLLKKVMPAKINALGMGEFFTPETMEMVQSSDEIQKKVLGLQLDLDEKVRSGTMTGAEAYQQAQKILADPEELALLDTDQLFDAQKFKNSEEGKSARAAQMAGSQLNKQVQAQNAAGDVEVSKKTAADFAKFRSQGGQAAALAKIKKLEEVSKDFASGKLKTGNALKGFVAGMSSTALAAIDQNLKAAMDNTRSSISLKESLDSQFARQEAVEQYNMRTIDPTLRTETNKKRIDDMLAEAKASYNNKIQEFQASGYMSTGAPKQKAAPAAKAPAMVNVLGASMSKDMAKAFLTEKPTDSAAKKAQKAKLRKELGF